MHKLADANCTRIAIATRADRYQLPIREDRTSSERGHTPVNTIESMRPTEKVSRTLARATNPRKLDHPARVNTHLETRINDSLRNGVMAATGTQGRLVSSIRLHPKANPIDLLSC